MVSVKQQTRCLAKSVIEIARQRGVNLAEKVTQREQRMQGECVEDNYAHTFWTVVFQACGTAVAAM